MELKCSCVPCAMHRGYDVALFVFSWAVVHSSPLKLIENRIEQKIICHYTLSVGVLVYELVLFVTNHISFSYHWSVHQSGHAHRWVIHKGF